MIAFFWYTELNKTTIKIFKKRKAGETCGFYFPLYHSYPVVSANFINNAVDTNIC